MEERKKFQKKEKKKVKKCEKLQELSEISQRMSQSKGEMRSDQEKSHEKLRMSGATF